MPVVLKPDLKQCQFQSQFHFTNYHHESIHAAVRRPPACPLLLQDAACACTTVTETDFPRLLFVALHGHLQSPQICETQPSASR